MGLFLQLGGILASESASSEAVASLKDMYPKMLENVAFYSEKGDRVLSFFDDYATGLDEVIAEISRHLERPAFWFHIHDGDLWMYRLYQNGIEIDRFNTSPGYWAEVDNAERKSWAGNAVKVSKVWPGVTPPDIERYLVDHEADSFDGEKKAYESDEYPEWDRWQLVDFLAKLGIPYPPDDEE